ncbi:MAG TPA: hypothetical protein VGJ20_39605 [Xanthobacteraceae bacterium]
MIKPLLKSSVVASGVFAAAWFRAPHLVMLIGYFLFYGILITLFAFVLGLPLALLIETLKIGRWWSYLAIAAAEGALLGAILSSHPRLDSCARPTATAGEQETCVENPHAITFSPWTRSTPGIIDSRPIQWTDYFGTIAFGAVIGGVLGASFWFFYSRARTEKKS